MQDLQGYADANGNPIIQKVDATEGEKWGRIAARILAGAAKGFAAGQGPGGAARAVGAGFDQGVQARQAPKQEAEHDLGVAEQQMTFKANHAALDQQYVRNAEAMRQGKIKFNQDQADYHNAIQEKIADAPGSEVLGDFKGVSDLPSFSAKYPKAMQGHVSDPNSYLMFTPIIDKDGNQTGSHVTVMSKPAGKQVMKDPPPIPTDYYDGPSHSIKTRLIAPAQGITYNDYGLAYKGQLAANSKLALDVAKDINKPPTTGPGARIAAATATDPTQAAQYTSAAEQIARDAVREKEAGRDSTGIGYVPSAQAQTTTATGAPVVGTKWGGGDPNSAFERVAQMVQQGKAVSADLKLPRGKGNPTWLDVVGRADQIDRDKGGPGLDPDTAQARYAMRKKTETDYGPSGTSGQRIGGFSTLLEHLGDVHDSIQHLRDTGSPALNKPVNKFSQDVMGNTQVGPATIRTMAPDSEFARTLSNNQALTKDEKEDAQKFLNANQTFAMQQANSKQMAKTAIDRLDPVFQGYRTAMRGEDSPTQLTPRAIQTLKNMGLYDEAMKRLYPNGVPRGMTAPAAAGGGGGKGGPPAGTIDVNAGGKIYHFQTQAQADDFTKRAKAAGAIIQ